MEEYKSEIEVLLDSLDKSVNSNTAWLHFSINSTQDFNLKIFLLNQLRTGHFHFTLVQSDINRGWEHFVSLIYSKNWKDTLIMLQKPGNSWNENENLTIEEISYEQAKNYIVDLLTGELIHFTKSPLGTTINNIYAREIFNNFITHIAGIKKNKLLSTT